MELFIKFLMHKGRFKRKESNSIPFQADPYYQIIYFLHSVCQYLLGIVFGNASSILASTVIITSGQFDMLLCSLKNIRATAMTFNGSRLKQLQLVFIFFFLLELSFNKKNCLFVSVFCVENCNRWLTLIPKSSINIIWQRN